MEYKAAIIKVSVRWYDEYIEKFEATEVRFGSDLLWMRLANGSNRHIPLRQVRQFSIDDCKPLTPGQDLIKVGIRWFDGRLEESQAIKVWFGSDMLGMRIGCGVDLYTPLRQVRWFSTTPESHEKVE